MADFTPLITPEKLAELQALSRERRAAIPPPSDEERRREQERYLKSVGFGKRYWHPEEAQIPPDIRPQVRNYAANIADLIARGKGLLISGVWGCGKTHILSYLALAAQPFPVNYALTEDLVQTILRAQRGGTRDEEARWQVRVWERCALLFRDDVDEVYGADYPLRAFVSFVKDRHDNCRAMVATLNSAARLAEDLRLAPVLDRWRDTMMALATAAKSQRGEGA